jgi:hypothetical protein
MVRRLADKTASLGGYLVTESAPLDMPTATSSSGAPPIPSCRASARCAIRRRSSIREG